MMKTLVRILLSLAVAAVLMTGSRTGAQEATTMARLSAYANGDHRSEMHRARNQYRHPVETLMWFGLRADMTVVEISPGRLWYSEILAPFLSSRGKLYLAGPDPLTGSDRAKKYLAELGERIKSNPDVFGGTELSVMTKDNLSIAADGSADMVLTFRNVHSWMRRGYQGDAFAAFYRALKPGGILGVVEHRGNPGLEQDPKAGIGYVRQDHVVAMAEAAGFELTGSSEINANPKDTRDHAGGVWSLPPTLRRSKDKPDMVAEEEYREIGESDRMTLKFVKPANPK